MARVAITEYAAKKLVLGEVYTGITVTKENIAEALGSVSEGNYIVKVDAGIKKRGKQGLIRVNVAREGLKNASEELFLLGYGRCIVEKMVEHKDADEKYLSISLEREGATVLYSPSGGITIEEKSEDIQRFFISRSEVLAGETTLTVAEVPLSLLLSKMRESNMSFMEINPFITKSGEFIPLDMAVEIDDVAARKLPTWIGDHIVVHSGNSAENEVKNQSAMTSAALTLKTINPNGAILTLLSGGGASLVAMDALVSAGLQEQIINYSEYSGAPTRDETRVYVNTLLSLLFQSHAPRKAILIAGGVANFTDIKLTFEGIIDAFKACIETLKKQDVLVCVRRGGPNQEEGLAIMSEFLTAHGIAHQVYGPELSLGAVGSIISLKI